MEEEWEDDDEYDDDPELEKGIGEEEDFEPVGPKFAPVFTGVLMPDGRPIIRHPLVIRMGFHPEEDKYYLPTKDEGPPAPGKGSIVGWYYERC